MKKAIMICTQLEAGGAQKVVMKLCSALNNSNEFHCEPWFLYNKKSAFPNSYKRILFNDKPKTFFQYVKLLLTIFKSLKNAKPDILITFTHYSNILVQPIAYLAGVENRIANQRNPRYSYSPIVRIIDSLWGLIGIYDKIIMVSDTAKDSFDKVSTRYLDKSYTIYNGIDELDFSEKSEIDIRQKWGIDSNKCILLNVGRLANQKNQKLLLDAISDLCNVHLFIVGEGELREELEVKIKDERLSNRVTLTGQLPQKDVYDLMKISTIFLMPSRYEGMSNALLESLQAGLPIIASDVPAQAEILREGDKYYGLLLKNDDKLAWKDSIMEICSNSKLQKHWRKRSLERASYFTTQKMIDNYLQILK